MYAWIDLLLVFALGCALGGILAQLRFRSKLKVYKQFIERHLDSVNLPLASRVFRSKPGMSARKQDLHQAANQGTK